MGQRGRSRDRRPERVVLLWGFFAAVVLLVALVVLGVSAPRAIVVALGAFAVLAVVATLAGATGMLDQPPHSDKEPPHPPGDDAH